MFVSSPTADDSSLLPISLLNIEQGFEKEAHLIAVAIMARAGFNPGRIGRLRRQIAI
jgi:hypothetical protein